MSRQTKECRSLDWTKMNIQKSQWKCWEAGSQSVITCMILFIKGIVTEYSVCAQAFDMRKKKIVPNNCMSVSTDTGHLCTERCQSYFHCTFGLCNIQVHTDMQNWPSAGPKGSLAVAVCTVLNFCLYMYMVWKIMCIPRIIKFDIFQLKDKEFLAKWLQSLQAKLEPKVSMASLENKRFMYF